MKEKYLILLCFLLGTFWGYGLNNIYNRSQEEKLKEINNQLKLEYDELKIRYSELDWQVTSCYYTLNRTEQNPVE